MIYDVVVKDKDGNIKRIHTAEELTNRHWDRFHDSNDMIGIVPEVVDCEDLERRFEKLLDDD